MYKIRILAVFFSVLLVVDQIDAQITEADRMLSTLNLIRREKFDNILPGAMRDSKIDMWIQVMGTKNGEEGNLDPLRLDLGSNTGTFVFTDRGGDRIERAVLGRASTTARNCGAYDIFGSESDLREFVTERDPERIGVNFSETIAVADGISHTDYLKLVNLLGEKYAQRIVSAENLITAFRERRVTSEIVFYGELCKETVLVMEEAIDLIEPGKTTVKDVSRWLVNQNMNSGYDSIFQFLLPGVFIQDSDGHENDARAGDDYVIQRGDLVHVDFG